MAMWDVMENSVCAMDEFDVFMVLFIIVKVTRKVKYSGTARNFTNY
jgi:hypothetical protein